jgi:hypothetical protein
VLDNLIAFFTSKTGVVAAVTVLLGLIASIVGLIKPILARQREKRAALRGLRITAPHLSKLSRSSNSYDLTFEIANTGQTAAVAVGVRLCVLDRASTTRVSPTVTEAPLHVNQQRVEFRPDKDVYDVRARAYGPGLPPLSFKPDEVEAFVVKLVAAKPERFTARIEAEWYRVEQPDKIETCQSEAFSVEFPIRAQPLK